MVRAVLVELDLTPRAERAAWEDERAAAGDALALAALAAGALVLADVYVEVVHGPGEDDAVGLTLAAVELERGLVPEPVIDDAVIRAALAEVGAALEEETGIEAGEAELRAALAVRVSSGLVAALRPLVP